jgi:hypothetical protein
MSNNEGRLKLVQSAAQQRAWSWNQPSNGTLMNSRRKWRFGEIHLRFANDPHLDNQRISAGSVVGYKTTAKPPSENLNA